MKKLDACVLGVVILLSCGCAQDSELAARYELEKRFYEARNLEREAYATLPVDAFYRWRIAVEGYTQVLNSNSARIPESVGWDAEVVRDMDRVALDAEIGIVRLGHLDHRLHAAVTHQHYAVKPLASALDSLWGFGSLRISALYDSTGAARRGAGLARRIRDIVDNPLLWIDTNQVRDSLMVAALELTPRGNGMEELANAFYSRIITTWPDSTVAATARVYRSAVRANSDDHAGALEDINAALAARETQWTTEALLLRRADLLAFDLGRREEGVRVLKSVAESWANSEFAWEARLRLALLGVGGAPVDALRELHLGDRTPASIAAAAMFARGVLLEESGRWDEAQALFWRLTQRHPFTVQARAAPLRVVANLRRRGDSYEAQRAAQRAVEYYLEVIARDSARLEPRHLAKDLFIEIHLLMGTPEAAAETLQSRSARWYPGSLVVARFKSALIYHYLLRRPEKAVEILQKTLVQHPRSRYARSIRWELERAREALEG